MFPRRLRLYDNTKEELEIRKMVDMIEEMEPHVKLTDCVVKLGEALDCLSDYVDEKIVSGKPVDEKIVSGKPIENKHENHRVNAGLNAMLNVSKF